jgi:rhodanese-related sulfurtransferase
MASVSLQEARKLVGSNEVDVVDLRDEDGWMDGHIPGAHRAGDDVEAKVESMDSDRRLLIVCQDGSRSDEVAEELSGGEREAVSLEGGMSAWLSEGMPSQPTEDYEPGPMEADGQDEDEGPEQDEGQGPDEGTDQDEREPG